jgi:transposase
VLATVQDATRRCAAALRAVLDRACAPARLAAIGATEHTGHKHPRNHADSRGNRVSTKPGALQTAADHQRKQLARDIVRDLRRHEASIKELEKQLRAAVTASGTTLTDIQGIGFLTAAKILALTGNIRRFPNQEHYASYAGTAPIDVSSGDQETHRLSRRGNRQLNAAIHVAAVTQARDPGPGRDHYRRKIAEHKTAKEARRSLKRRISNAVYRRILADHQRLQRTAA